MKKVGRKAGVARLEERNAEEEAIEKWQFEGGSTWGCLGGGSGERIRGWIGMGKTCRVGRLRKAEGKGSTLCEGTSYM